jgi:hypothetical protein
MPNLPSLAEQVDLEDSCDTIPNPGPRSNLEGLRLFIILGVDGASLGGVDNYFIWRRTV